MAKPSINAGLEELAGQMARGAASGSSQRSAGNVGGGMGGASTPRAAGGGIMGIPSRTGAPPMGAGSYMNQPGSPGQNTNVVTPGTVPMSSLGGASKQILTHGRTLGAIAHLRSIGADHPHLQQHHAKATAALAGMKKSGMKKQGLSGGPKFGSLGGSSSSGNVGPGIPGVGMASPGAAPLGASSLPDEM